MSQMERIVCTYCGANVQIDDCGKRARCKYCNSEYHFKEEKGPALILALNNAAGYLSRHDFDSAIVHYESVLKEYPNDAEAAWGHVISTYGIVYEKDDRTGNMIPTCSRIVKESILDNRSYKLAIANCADEQREIYEDGAAFIDRVQKKIKRAMEDEEDFDVFISFKAKDENGITTEDSVIARNIYDELTKRGIKAFFSEVTLKNRFGDEFEPIIYRALYSCKFFILVSTKEAYIEAPWVKNEWTRFRDRVMDEGLSGACAAVYKNFSAYSLPRLFQTQSVELEKHPFDYAQLVADNLSGKFGLAGRNNEALEEQKRLNAELEAKQRKMQEELDELRRKNTAAPKLDMDNLTEMYRKMEEAKAKAEAERKAREAKEREEAEKLRALQKVSLRDMEIVNGVLKKYRGRATEIAIPDSVSSIYEFAFEKCNSITSVIIPDKVTKIGCYAFSGCNNLSSVSIGNGVLCVSDSAFKNCPRLTSVTLGKKVNDIENHAFEGCINLRWIRINGNLSSVSESAFNGCNRLETVVIGGKLDRINRISFLAKVNIQLSDDNEYFEIKDGMIYNKADNTPVRSLSTNPARTNNVKPASKPATPAKTEGSVVLSNNDHSSGTPSDMQIKNGELIKYSGNAEKVIIPYSVNNIGIRAFSNNTTLKEVTIPSSVKRISRYAFRGCTGLRKITIPSSVTAVDEGAFLGCSNLIVRVDDPSSIKNWSKKWDSDVSEVYSRGVRLRKNIFGVYK